MVGINCRSCCIGSNLPELLGDCEQDERYCGKGQLAASTDHGREQEGVVTRPEHVTVDLLPAIFIPQISLNVVQIIIFRVALKG